MLDIHDGKVIRHEAVRDDITMLGQRGVFPPNPAVGLRMVAQRADEAARLIDRSAAPQR